MTMPTAPLPRTTKSVLFFGKHGDADCLRAADFCRSVFGDVTVHLGQWGMGFPESARTWSGDLIVSYLSRWIIPGAVLERARDAAINFHPGSPEYPGIGCVNFAIHERSPFFGTTCHHMNPKVDTGALIAVKRFAVFANDSVGSILERTYAHQIALFYDVMTTYAASGQFPSCGETWTRRPFTRKELEALNEIPLDASPEEVALRVRAMSHGAFAPYITLHGFKFGAAKPEA